MSKILIADDEKDIREFISYNLEKEGHQVLEAIDGEDAYLKAQEYQPDLLLLDVMMPGLDGIELCHKIRSLPNMANVLIMLLTARTEDFTQIAGFDAGADDFVNKPIKPRILVKRIEALLRRQDSRSADSPEDHSKDKLIIDKDRFLIIYDGKEINLPKKEFKLLELLASTKGRVFTREEIMNRVWGEDVYTGDRTIDVHIRKLREKIDPNFIVTVKGIGYKLIEN